MNKRILIVGALALSTSLLRAQGAPDLPGETERSAHIGLLTRADRDSVVLRWGVSTPGGWVIANRFGYRIDRATILKGGGKAGRTRYEAVSAEPIKPWTLNEWKKRGPEGNKYAGIAAQAMHGETFEPKSSDPGAVNTLRNAASELSNRFGFSMFAADNDAVAAEGLGLRFVDRNVKVGERYVYRLSLAGKDTSYRIDTAFAVVDVAAFIASAPPPSLTAESREKAIVLQWDNPPYLPYSAYYVYRSDDQGKTWKQLNSIPFVEVTNKGATEKAKPRYHDSTVVNYKKYRYRVRGVTPFAELSAPAEVDAMAKDLTSPYAPMVGHPRQTGPHTIILHWELPEISPDLAGFVVARSGNSIDGYHDLDKRLPATARSFVDPEATEQEPYYIVGAVDTAGNIAPSYPVFSQLIDSLPPSVPTGLRGTIDTSGVVHLNWHLGSEPTIIGYRVLWANDPSHEFAQKTGTPWADTAFVDTVNLNTLTRYVYYRIAAVNSRYAHSEMSPILALRRPDRFPPEPPVFTGCTVSDTTVSLAWAVSTSNDVDFQLLYRRLAGGRTWNVLTKLPSHSGEYVDKGVVKTTTYEYMVESVDSSGLHSAHVRTVQARPYDTGVRPTVENLQVAHDPAKKTVRLTWKYAPAGKEKYWFVIYRGLNGSVPAQVASVDERARGFVDKAVTGKGKYSYSVRVFTPTAESGYSKEASAEVR